MYTYKTCNYNVLIQVALSLYVLYEYIISILALPLYFKGTLSFDWLVDWLIDCLFELLIG